MSVQRHSRAGLQCGHPSFGWFQSITGEDCWQGLDTPWLTTHGGRHVSSRRRAVACVNGIRQRVVSAKTWDGEVCDEVAQAAPALRGPCHYLVLGSLWL